MKLPFKCGFCEERFVEMHDYNNHCSQKHAPAALSKGALLPVSIPRVYLKCGYCRFNWLDLTKESCLGLSKYNGLNLCHICIEECEKRKHIVNKYYHYFNNVTDMWDVRHKEFYVECRKYVFQCCICHNKYCEINRDYDVHYSLAVWANHLVCRFCYDNRMDFDCMQNCNCKYQSHIKKGKSKVDLSDSD
jgi:hypothetical protein